MLISQQNLFPYVLSKKGVSEKNTSTFINNMKLPIHRWFRFSAGFSAQWVKEIIQKAILQKGSKIKLLDPFVGSGTALLCADECGIDSYGIESQPFVARITKIKTHWDCDIQRLISLAEKTLKFANNYSEIYDKYPSLIHKCYPSPVLLKLEGLKKGWQSMGDNSIESDFVWLCITSILRAVSSANTAQWQYVLPKKTKKNVQEVFEAFQSHLNTMIDDLSLYQRNYGQPRSVLFFDSSINCDKVPDNTIDLVITSPPYANNYDYADATRLEMSFWGEVSGWSDLHEKARKNLLRSCSQHASILNQPLDEILSDPDLKPILPEIKEITKKLEDEREKHGGKKDYHLMIAGYFSDMAKVWKNLHRMCRKGCKVCFVVGDSAPYGIYVPVDKWIGEIALAFGFKSFKFDKIRDRNVKWKNRKHKVLLHEGNLWISN